MMVNGKFIYLQTLIFGSSRFGRHYRKKKQMLTLIRGLPGSGRVRLAESMRKWNSVIISIDDYFVEGDRYNYRPVLLGNAIKWCQEETRYLLSMGYHPIVHNTFARKKTMTPYYEIAKMAGSDVEVHSLFDSGYSDEELFERTELKIPLRMIRNMRKQWEE